MSRSNLYKKCMCMTGKSPVDILQDVRIRNAIVLLENSSLTISEIAYSVGYSDPRYFSSRFRKLTSKSPTEYKSGQ
jgi:AraC-like DNA-binding protein